MKASLKYCQFYTSLVRQKCENAVMRIWCGVGLSFRISHLSFQYLTPSWQFFFVCFGIAFGIVLGNFFRIPLPMLYAVIWAGLTGALITFRRYQRAFFIVIFLLVMTAGFFRSEFFFQRLERQQVRRLLGQELVLRGAVRDPPLQQKQSVRYRFKVNSINNADLPKAQETITVVARPFPEVVMGDRLALTCEIREERRHSRPSTVCLFPEVVIESRSPRSLFGILGVVRNHYVRSLNRIMPEPASGFATGLLFGGRSGLSEEWREALIATGTSHLVALSGYNVAIIASFLFFIFKGLALRRRWRVPAVGIILFLFVIMVGAEASIVRAAIMGMLVVIARQAGRLASSRNAIAFTAALMLIADPTLLIADIGFQLSFLATLGMIYLYPIFENLAKDLPNLFSFKEALLMAVSAEIFVTPLILYYFERLSFMAPLVNMLVVPVIPFIMFFGFFGGLAGLMFIPLGQIIGFSGWVGAAYVLNIINFAGRLPMASINLALGWLFLITYYIVLGSLLIWRHMRGIRATFTYHTF